MKIIEDWKALVAICADKRITRDELPAFLEAIADLLGGIIELISPILKGGATTTLKRIAAGIILAAEKK